MRGAREDVLGRVARPWRDPEGGSQPAAPSSVAGVDRRGRLASTARAACSAVVDRAEVHERELVGLPRARRATIRRATPTAPPNQTAATPIPPHAKPGRSRYHPGRPTGVAGASSKSTAGARTSASPRDAQAPGDRA